MLLVFIWTLNIVYCSKIYFLFKIFYLKFKSSSFIVVKFTYREKQESYFQLILVVDLCNFIISTSVQIHTIFSTLERKFQSSKALKK